MDKLSAEDKVKAQGLSGKPTIKPDIKSDQDPRSLISQMLVEYGLLIVFIAVFVMLMMGSAGQHINELWSRINSSIPR